MEEPKVFCPKCGEKTNVIEWFEYEPGKGLGYSECPNCGTLDFKMRNGRIISILQPDPDETEENTEETMYGLSAYDPEDGIELPEASPA